MVKHWVEFDAMGMLQQLGVVPPIGWLLAEGAASTLETASKVNTHTAYLLMNGYNDNAIRKRSLPVSSMMPSLQHNSI
jgi:hypothetical protein